jgi:endoglucanase
MGLVFFILVFTLLFASFLSGIYIKYYAIAPTNPMAVRSTIDIQGVTSPYGDSDIRKSIDSPVGSVLGASSVASGNIASSFVPPKPAWTGMDLYVDPLNSASQYAKEYPLSADISYIEHMGQVPVAQWFGDWNGNITYDTNAYVSSAASVNKVPVLVIYNIPRRDCGGYSTGGATSLSAYTQWIQGVASGIGKRTSVVILEPDALGALDCLSGEAQQQERYQSISNAVTILKSNVGTSVYIDAGTPVWQSVATMAQRLSLANIGSADGFSLNVSYFASNTANQTYGDSLSSSVGNKHYVIDTSRNGGNNAVSGMLCNPTFASLGSLPTTKTGKSRNDGLLWIKIPWESDGPCNGSPDPGVGYWSYAIQLAKNAGW